MDDHVFFIEDFLLFYKLNSIRDELQDDDLCLLRCLSKYPNTWTAEICRDPKRFLGKEMNDRTVRRRLSLLLEYGLINRNNKHGIFAPKESKLSVGGIYYLFLNDRVANGFFESILRNYEDNILFKMFLYPYLNKNTLLAIQDSNLLSQIYFYLYKCCVDIGNISWMSSKDQYTTQEIFIWQDVPDNKIETKRLGIFLEQKFNLTWLKDAETTKSEDKSSIWIRYSANYVSIKLDKDKKSATMKIRDNKKEQEYELIIKQFKPDFLSVRMPIMSVKENMAHHLLIITQQRVPGFILDMASQVVPGSADSKLLSNDEKFLHAFNKSKVKLNEMSKIFQ